MARKYCVTFYEKREKYLISKLIGDKIWKQMQ